jgi:hypothetical protein
MHRLLTFTALTLVLALVTPLAQAQACKPILVGGTGTAPRTATIDFGVINGSGLRIMAEVGWYYCSEPSSASGWRTVRLYCDVSPSQAAADIAKVPPPDQIKRAACLAKLLALTPATMGPAWTSMPSLQAAGLEWADVLAQPLFAQHRPAPEQWVVAKASSTANPPGTLPAYPWVNGVRGTVSNGRATSGQLCNRMAGAVPWLGVNGRTDQVAQCVVVKP